MPTDRLARLRALIEQWKAEAAIAYEACEPDAYDRAGVYESCAAELEGVLADPPQVGKGDETCRSHTAQAATEQGIGVQATRCSSPGQSHPPFELTGAAPTPAAGAPQEPA
jgi:hypothetical protein